jgi:hypothetical protein
MEALGGSLVLTNSSVPGEHENLVAVCEETDAVGVNGCSSELEVGAQTLDVLPRLDDALPEMVIQSMENRARVANSVPLGNEMELN